jgi:hypothetical protein
MLKLLSSEFLSSDSFSSILSSYDAKTGSDFHSGSFSE